MAAGDYAVRVETGSTDEVGQLARAFNTMSADLATVDRQRRDLVASVSHELRTPLAALVAVLENLDDGVIAPTRRPCTSPAPRPSGWATSSTTCSTCPGSTRGSSRSSSTDLPVVPLLEAVVAESAPDPARASAASPSRRSSSPPDLVVRADRARLHQLLATCSTTPPGTARPVAWCTSGPGVVGDDDPARGRRPGPRHRAAGPRAGLRAVRHPAGRVGRGHRSRAGDRPLGDRSARGPDHRRRPGARRDRCPLPRRAAHHAVREVQPHGHTHPPDSPPRRRQQWPRHRRCAQRARARSSTTRSAGSGPSAASRRCAGSCWPASASGCSRPGRCPTSTSGSRRRWCWWRPECWCSGLTRHRRSPFTWACAALAFGFACVLTLRDAEWIGVLGLLVSALLTTAALTAGTTALGMFAGRPGVAVLRAARAAVARPDAAVVRRRGERRGRHTHGAPVARSACSSSGCCSPAPTRSSDTGSSAVVPDVEDTLVLRVFLTVAVGGTVLAAAYLALNPPQVERPGVRRPAQHRFEWLAPVLLVDAVFVLFLAAQAAAFFGGHDYVQRATGLTYADYVHQGFAQLTIATALTLLVVWAAARKARLDVAADRWWLRGSLGALCAAHAGRGRLGAAPDGPLPGGLRVHPAAAAGRRLRGLARAGRGRRDRRRHRPARPVAAAVRAALGCRRSSSASPSPTPTRGSPQHNLERYEATGKVDWSYLREP